MSGRDTTFSGGTVYMNSGKVYTHVQKLTFNPHNESLTIIHWDLSNRKLIQLGFKDWVHKGHSLKDFPFPINVVTVSRTDIRKILYPPNKKLLV